MISTSVPNGPDDTAESVALHDEASPAAWLDRYALLIACAVAAAIKIWLTLAFGMRAAGNADADDRLFVVLAEHLLHGDWLGPYGRHTLVKGPFFPIWIAATFLAHIPLLLSYQLLHIGGCALFIVALRPIVPQRSARFVLFMLLLFDPSTYSAMASWVIREGIYLPLTMIILAAAFALLTRWDRKPWPLAGWSLGLGLALAAFWTTREEGVWILPALAVVGVYLFISMIRMRRNVFSRSMLLFIPAALCIAGVLAVCALNHRYYGVFEVVDMKSHAFERANGALMRVRHEQWNQYANVPKEVRLKVYEISPAFAELRDFLEGPPGVNWGRGAEVWLDEGTPSPEDIRGGFFVFALRQAVQGQGYYQDALAADAYFARLADEINAACNDGRLECGPERASLTPPWRREYFGLGARSLLKGLRMTAMLDEVEVMNMPSAGPADRMIIFEDLGRARINPLMGDTGESPRLPSQAQLDKKRFKLMGQLNSVYKAIAPYASAVSCAAFVLICILEIRARTLSPELIILMALLASFAARMAILVLISIASFEAMKLRYFLPLYPMMILFWFVSVYYAVKLVRQIPKRTPSESGTGSVNLEARI